jgi:formylmethanofuran dehydrogenase subunit E
MIDDQTLERVVDFHGHMCPGLAIGVQAAQIALREIGPHAKDEEVVAVVETDMCAVDAVQFLTGCTFGKGNLIHRDWGKNAYTFFRRSDGRAVRIAARPDAWQRNPEHRELFAKVRAGEASPTERARFHELHLSESERVLALDPDVLFAVQEVAGPPPQPARIHASVICARCGEATMETRIGRVDGRDVCPPCFEAVRGGEEPVGVPSLRAR